MFPPKYSYFIVVMAFFNILLLYNLSETSRMKPITPASCEAICERQLVDLRLAATGLLEKLKELVTQDKFTAHLQDIRDIVGDTGIEREMLETPNDQLVLHYSCPDTYKGSTFGYPLYKTGFVRENCEKRRITPIESTTLILDRPQATNQQLEAMINYAANIYRAVIIVVEEHSNLNFKTSRHYSEDKVMILRNTDQARMGRFLSDAVQYVMTTFTLVAPFIARFDNSTDIERMLHALEVSKADMVGGSIKNVETGEWDRGCYQTSLKLYTLKYTKGYTRSKHECLYCDYLISPFLIYTQQLEIISFNFDLPSSVYRDYFLHMKMNSKTILACPDVMFYTKRPVHTETEMASFAEMWNIKRLVDAHDKVFWFGCRHKGTPCRRDLRNPAPPCCRANLADAIKFVHEQCIKNNITCEVQEGTLMGTVKFNHVLPWERDADITILSADFNRFADLKPVFDKKGYEMQIDTRPRCCKEGVMEGGNMVIGANGWHIDVFGQHKLSTGKNEVRTKVNFAGSWVFTPENPGQSLRNRYGSEITSTLNTGCRMARSPVGILTSQDSSRNVNYQAIMHV